MTSAERELLLIELGERVVWFMETGYDITKRLSK
jgi:hypothetical protein